LHVKEVKRTKVTLTDFKDPGIEMLASQIGRQTLSAWAIECSERVLHFYEEKYPEDDRPRKAIQTLQEWIDTGEFKMAVIRKASLDAHGAALEVGEDNAARSAAHAAGQAVAAAHVPRHAISASIYALQAIYRNSRLPEAEIAVVEERAWQYQKLLDLSRRLL
jgi:hypothetical protein